MEIYNIVKVKYEDRNFPKTFSGRKYLYFTTKKLSIGDIVIVPTKNGSKKAIVCDLYNKVEDIDKLSVKKNNILSIIFKIDKEAFLKESKIVLEK